jgi:hypothetical protein
VKRAAVALAAAALLGAGFGAGLAVHGTPASSPRPCRIGAGQMPSGDAGRTGGRTWVCTDGTLVRVTGYGNPR